MEIFVFMFVLYVCLTIKQVQISLQHKVKMPYNIKKKVKFSYDDQSKSRQLKPVNFFFLGSLI